MKRILLILVLVSSNLFASPQYNSNMFSFESDEIRDPDQSSISHREIKKVIDRINSMFGTTLSPKQTKGCMFAAIPDENGGHITFCGGILKRIENKISKKYALDILAFIIAHEAAHFLIGDKDDKALTEELGKWLSEKKSAQETKNKIFNNYDKELIYEHLLLEEGDTADVVNKAFYEDMANTVLYDISHENVDSIAIKIILSLGYSIEGASLGILNMLDLLPDWKHFIVDEFLIFRHKNILRTQGWSTFKNYNYVPLELGNSSGEGRLMGYLETNDHIEMINTLLAPLDKDKKLQSFEHALNYAPYHEVQFKMYLYELPLIGDD